MFSLWCLALSVNLVILHIYPGQTQTPYKMTSLDEKSPVVFETVDQVLFYSDTWTILTKFTPLHYETVIQMVEKCDNKLETMCSSIPDVDFQRYCHLIVQETEANISNLKLTANRMRRVMRSKRQKRALEFIGSFSKWAFGTMDSEDARKVYHQLEFLHKKNDDSFQLMHRQISVMKSNFDALTKPIAQLAEEIEVITSGVGNLSQTFLEYSQNTNKEVSMLKMRSETIALASVITAKILEIQNQQALELSIIDDLYNNKLHPFILDESDINGLIRNITVRGGLSFESIIRSAAMTNVFTIQGNLIVKVTLPLPDSLRFNLHKVYALPTALDEIWDMIIDTNSEYIAESDNHELFVMLNDEQYSRCARVATGEKTKDIAVCQHESPVFTSGSNECLIELLQHAATSKVSCKYAAVPASKGIFLKMTASNEWLFKVKDSFVLNLKCANQQYTATLNGSGILKMEQPCEASAKGFKLFYESHSEVANDFKQPMVDHSELVQALQASSVLTKQPATPKLLPIRIGNHKQFSNNLNMEKKSIEELEQSWKQLNSEHKVEEQDWEIALHRYSILSMVVLVAVVICATYLVRCIRSRPKCNQSTRIESPSIAMLSLREPATSRTPRKRAPSTPQPLAATPSFHVTSARV